MLQNIVQTELEDSALLGNISTDNNLLLDSVEWRYYAQPPGKIRNWTEKEGTVDKNPTVFYPLVNLYLELRDMS